MIITISALGAAGCGSGQAVPPGAIAVVDGRTITRVAFDAQLDQARRSYEASGREFPAPGTAAYDRLRQVAVRLLVERAELEIEAERLEIRIAPAQIAERLRRFKARTFGGSERRYRDRLREQHVTDREVRAAIRAEVLSEALRARGAQVPKPAKVVYAKGFGPSNEG